MTTSSTGSTVGLERATKRFRAVTAVDEVSWAPTPGQVTALVGLNGAGKSTLMRLATGLVKPSSGAVRHSSGRSRRDRGGRSWSALIEAPALHDGLSVRRNLAVHAALTRATRRQVDSVIDEADIRTVLAKRAGVLSQGYRQRVALAIALLANPQVVFLDEPTNALDPESILDLRRLIRSLADRGASVVVSSHLLRELDGVADLLLVMGAGRIVYDGSFASFVGPGSIRIRPVEPAHLIRLAALIGQLGHDAQLHDGAVSVTLDISGAPGPDLVAADIAVAAAAEEILLLELAHLRPSLEERFHATIAADPSC